MSAVMERDDVEPVANERLDRVLTGTVHRRALPRRGCRGVLAWQQFLHWSDVIIFAVPTS